MAPQCRKEFDFDFVSSSAKFPNLQIFNHNRILIKWSGKVESRKLEMMDGYDIRGQFCQHHQSLNGDCVDGDERTKLAPQNARQFEVFPPSS
jgi:hypothetical protein